MENSNKLFNNSELVKLTDSLNASQTMRLNLATFFGTSHLAFISYSLSQNNLYILVLASILLIFFMIADHFILRGIYGYYIRAKRIIKNENNAINETLFDMFRLVIVDRKNMKSELARIIAIDNDNQRFKAIKKLPLKIKSVLGFWVPLFIFLMEIVTAIILYINC